MAIEIINPHRDGAVRWNCECGRVFGERQPEEAFKHALMGHECVFEIWVQGRWLNDGWTVGDMILAGKQLKGENVAEFRDRVRRSADVRGLQEFI